MPKALISMRIDQRYWEDTYKCDFNNVPQKQQRTSTRRGDYKCDRHLLVCQLESHLYENYFVGLSAWLSVTDKCSKWKSIINYPNLPNIKPTKFTSSKRTERQKKSKRKQGVQFDQSNFHFNSLRANSKPFTECPHSAESANILINETRCNNNSNKKRCLGAAATTQATIKINKPQAFKLFFTRTRTHELTPGRRTVCLCAPVRPSGRASVWGCLARLRSMTNKHTYIRIYASQWTWVCIYVCIYRWLCAFVFMGFLWR